MWVGFVLLYNVNTYFYENLRVFLPTLIWVVWLYFFLLLNVHKRTFYIEPKIKKKEHQVNSTV